MNNMSAPTVKPSLTNENRSPTVIPLPPKIPLPQNSLISQTNYNSFQHSPVVPATNEVPVQHNTDKPLNLYVSPIQKDPTNGVPAPGPSHLETLKPVPLPSAVTPANNVTNLTTKEENTVNQTEVTSTSGFNSSESVEHNKPAPVINQNSVGSEQLKSNVEKEHSHDIKLQQKPAVEKSVKPDKKEPEQTTSGSSNQNSKPESLGLQITGTELGEPSQPVKKRKRESQDSKQEDSSSAESSKAKRARLPTQVYQSSLPDFLVGKFNAPAKVPKPTEQRKLITFYKHEFLAVRNPEGGFYICQAYQNIHQKSSKIKIRWFTDLPHDVFQPDFFDTTEFDCILTNVNLIRLEKDKWKLPENERTRIVNILKRALDVEKGVAKPSVTEEHPDGLDLSLYKDEAQLNQRKQLADKDKKNKIGKRQSQSTIQSSTAVAGTSSSSSSRKSPQISYLAVKSTTSAATKSKNATTGATGSKRGRKAGSANKKATALKNKKTAIKKKVFAGKSTSVVDIDSERKSSSSSNAKVPTTAKDKNEKISGKNVSALKPLKSNAVAANTATASSFSGTTSTTTAAKQQTANQKGVIKKNSTPVSSPTVTDNKSVKLRNAGSAVAAKIISASALPGKNSRDRKASSTIQKKT